MSIKVSNLTAEMGGAITIRIYGPAQALTRVKKVNSRVEREI